MSDKQVANVEFQAFEQQLAEPRAAWRTALPSTIDPQRFKDTVLVAVQRNPALLQLDRGSLMLAAMDAAARGLLPDGKEGAIVVRYDFSKRAEVPTFQSMVWGLRKLANQAGIKIISAEVVFEGEPFRVVRGSDPHIEHEQLVDLEDMTKARAVYCVLKDQDGVEISRALSSAYVQKIKDTVAIDQKGQKRRIPWNGPFEREMWCKTAIHATFKRVTLDPANETHARLAKAVAEPEADGAVIDHAPLTREQRQAARQEERAAASEDQAAALEGAIDDMAPPEHPAETIIRYHLARCESAANVLKVGDWWGKEIKKPGKEVPAGVEERVTEMIAARYGELRGAPAAEPFDLETLP